MNRNFASDNTAPVAPEIVKAILAANEGAVTPYGGDDWSARAKQRFRDQFGAETDVYFAFNGTGANVAGLSALLRPWEAVLCPETAHLQTDECGAFERFSGSKIIPIPTKDGKLRPADLEPYLKPVDVHFPQPRILSISQATEYGGLYELDELRALCGFAHERGLNVHIDGARLSNAAAALGVSLKVLTASVDLLTFGGTKNGMMFGDAICFLKPGLAAGTAAFVQKQAMQLSSKMRYIAAQFEAVLTGDLWLQYASHANDMTKRLEERVRSIEGIRITRPVRCNAIFATMDRAAIERVQRKYSFLVWDERLPEVRWMTHWATRPDDVDAFADALERGVSA